MFGPADQTFVEDCHYVDIVPERRICYAMTISRGDTRITVSMVTVELASHGRRCDVRVTDQLAILDGGDTARDRERGWRDTRQAVGGRRSALIRRMLQADRSVEGDQSIGG
jgi:hypothetical protein